MCVCGGGLRHVTCVCVARAERLVESLRLPAVPILHAQVFLFFRVLLLRMSPQHLTSLWPTMITELVREHTLGTQQRLVEALLFASLTIKDSKSIRLDL